MGTATLPSSTASLLWGETWWVLVWKTLKTYLTDNYNSALERKASHQPKLCSSFWYFLKQLWCLLEMGNLSRIGFDATFKPFLFKLKFLESGSPQQSSAEWHSLSLSIFKFISTRKILVIKKGIMACYGPESGINIFAKKHLQLPGRDKAPCDKQKQKRSAREKDKRRLGWSC